MEEHFLYILIHNSKPIMKIGITNDVKARVKSIERDFGKINKDKSEIYRCENRKLIENIERGLHALLHNYYHSPDSLGGGSTEWFEEKGISLAKTLIEVYRGELSIFSKEGFLMDFINRKIDYNKIHEKINEQKTFHQKHYTAVKEVSKLITSNKVKIDVEFIEGGVKVSNLPTEELKTIETPKFKWVHIEENSLFFDYQAYNAWKKSGENKEIRGLVEIKFFSDFTWKNYMKMFN